MYCELIAAHYFTILPANKQAKPSCSPEWHGKRPEPALRHAYYQAPSLSLPLSLFSLSFSAYQLRQCDKQQATHDDDDDALDVDAAQRDRWQSDNFDCLLYAAGRKAANAAAATATATVAATAAAG